MISQLSERRAALVALVMGVAVALRAPVAPADETDSAKLSELRELVRLNEPARMPLLYGKFEVEVTGPASLFPLPAEFKGEDYRQVTIEEWWAQDQKIAVATHAGASVYLDGRLIQSIREASEPSFTYVFDGERTYYHDLRADGRLLQVNASWPFQNCAYPVYFGRSVSAVAFGEVLDGNAAVEFKSAANGSLDAQVSFVEGVTTVKAWLDPRQEGLCTRIEVSTDRGVIKEESYRFARTPEGVLYPTESVQHLIDARGRARTTTWRTLEFRVDPPVPADLFSPLEEKAAIVLDGATGAVLKGPDGVKQ